MSDNRFEVCCSDRESFGTLIRLPLYMKEER